MDAGSSTSKKPKRKFAPRAPPPRRPTVPPPTADADGEEKTAQMIASSYAIGRVKPKPEKKASAEVAFQPTSASLPIAPAAVPEDVGKCSDPDLKSSPPADVLATVSSAANQKDGEEETITVDDGDALLVPEAEIDYVEPWDPRNPYSPITLPLRKPSSGHQELRDKEGSGVVARYPVTDESTLNSAEKLGLTLEEENGKRKMIFFQLPGPLPVKKELADANSEEDNTQRRSAFDGLKEGFMGKMCVYKSGAVKLKLGDILYDVSPGPDTFFADTVAAINTRKREFGNLGSTEKMATVTPDIVALLNSEADVEARRER
ncbi:PREDICTED: uncharacterized protein LOC104811532 [Tarenaya hassleriana]|uniref:uncharacterized protein LOC104811532 n=1 Tax=Tarenaya hassleriana TaxID=28532 RepID=UPI00053C402B|nr:PREDICTED: uncharacterized protein LOC104811532 [Tarenaya hassleriana]